MGAYLAGRAGGVGEGFRPKGEKAVYPKSKKEDPTGREVGNPLAEGIGRSVFFQRGQMLPYGEFKKERPDVMPSTYRDYMAYQYAKPEAGSLVTIDPKRGSFTALGGMVRGSAKGLNDPELRISDLKPLQVRLVDCRNSGNESNHGFLRCCTKGPQYDTNPGNTFVPM